MTRPAQAPEDRHNALIQSMDLGGSGLRVVVKDCIDIAGTVTGCGSAALRDRAAATSHAPVVRHLLDAGCRITGKAAMHELAFGMTGVNPACGTPVNPGWPDRIPGGSSSGSAVAVAAGLCDFAVGTDTGGSIRQPAICCGIYGMKPSFGRIDRTGCHPADSTLDCVGVFARSAPMLTRAMAAIDPGFVPEDLVRAPRLARIALDLDRPLGDTLLYTLMEGVPDLGRRDVPVIADAFQAGMTLIAAETFRAFGHLLNEGAPLGDDIRTRLIAARHITPEALNEAEAVRVRFTSAVDDALEGLDALMTPALPDVPPTLAEATDPAKVLPLTRFLRPFNLSGHPAIVLPIVPADGAPPLGIQIVGRRGDDARLCAIAEWLAQSCRAFRRPDFHMEETA